MRIVLIGAAVLFLIAAALFARDWRILWKKQKEGYHSPAADEAVERKARQTYKWLALTLLSFIAAYLAE